MEKATIGMWVEIENHVLSVSERASHLPSDTKETPLIMWTKGFLMDETAVLDDVVSVKTLSDRIVSGKLVVIDPRFEHDFGNTVIELLGVGRDIRKELENS